MLSYGHDQGHKKSDLKEFDQRNMHTRYDHYKMYQSTFCRKVKAYEHKHKNLHTLNNSVILWMYLETI